MSKELKNQVTPITRRRMFKSKNRSLLTLRISATILALLFAIAIFQPFFYTADPAASDLSLRLQSPSLGGALLGTDALGQDVYSRVIAGFRWSLGIGTVGTFAWLFHRIHSWRKCCVEPQATTYYLESSN